MEDDLLAERVAHSLKDASIDEASAPDPTASQIQRRDGNLVASLAELAERAGVRRVRSWIDS